MSMCVGVIYRKREVWFVIDILISRKKTLELLFWRFLLSYKEGGGNYRSALILAMMKLAISVAGIVVAFGSRRPWYSN